MTQLTGSRGIGRNTALQIAAAVVGVVAVAALGVSFGRWVVPANESSSGGASVTNESATSPASIIAERHFELRGATGEFDAVSVAPVIVGESPASAIAERHFELRGATGEFDAVSVAPVIVGESPASAIAQHHYEQRGQVGEVGAQAPAVTTNAESPAAEIAQRHFELRAAPGEFDEVR